MSEYTDINTKRLMESNNRLNCKIQALEEKLAASQAENANLRSQQFSDTEIIMLYSRIARMNAHIAELRRDVGWRDAEISALSLQLIDAKEVNEAKG